MQINNMIIADMAKMSKNISHPDIKSSELDPRPDFKEEFEPNIILAIKEWS